MKVQKKIICYAGDNNSSNMFKFANITMRIKVTENINVATGPILIPIEESSKNLINPAPPIGMGPPLPLFFFLLDVFPLDI